MHKNKEGKDAIWPKKIRYDPLMFPFTLDSKKYQSLTHCVAWFSNGESENASRILIPGTADAKTIFPHHILYRKASDVSY